jgi:hypothetical protein
MRLRSFAVAGGCTRGATIAAVLRLLRRNAGVVNAKGEGMTAVQCAVAGAATLSGLHCNLNVRNALPGFVAGLAIAGRTHGRVYEGSECSIKCVSPAHLRRGIGGAKGICLGVCRVACHCAARVGAAYIAGCNVRLACSAAGLAETGMATCVGTGIRAIAKTAPAPGSLPRYGARSARGTKISVGCIRNCCSIGSATGTGSFSCVRCATGGSAAT